MLKNATPPMQNRHFAPQDGAKTGPRWAKLGSRWHLEASWVVLSRRCQEDVVLSRLKSCLGAFRSWGRWKGCIAKRVRGGGGGEGRASPQGRSVPSVPMTTSRATLRYPSWADLGSLRDAAAHEGRRDKSEALLKLSYLSCSLALAVA